jgi:hypothetical protein
MFTGKRKSTSNLVTDANTFDLKIDTILEPSAASLVSGTKTGSSRSIAGTFTSTEQRTASTKLNTGKDETTTALELGTDAWKLSEATSTYLSNGPVVPASISSKALMHVNVVSSKDTSKTDLSNGPVAPANSSKVSRDVSIESSKVTSRDLSESRVVPESISSKSSINVSISSSKFARDEYPSTAPMITDTATPTKPLSTSNSSATELQPTSINILNSPQVAVIGMSTDSLVASTDKSNETINPETTASATPQVARTDIESVAGGGKPSKGQSFVALNTDRLPSVTHGMQHAVVCNLKIFFL